MLLDAYMRELTKELELDFSLKTDIPGVYRIPLDNELLIHVTEIPRGFALTCVIGEAPSEGADAYYESIMLANLLGEGTEGAVLGLDEGGKMLLLAREVYEEMDYRRFSEIIEDFINALDYWYTETRKLTHPQEQEEETANAEE